MGTVKAIGRQRTGPGQCTCPGGAGVRRPQDHDRGCPDGRQAWREDVRADRLHDLDPDD